MTSFPKGLAHLVPTDIIGTIAGIVVRPARKAPVVEVAEWDIGSDLDHSKNNARAVTLISAAHISAIAATLGRESIDWRPLRRNLLVSGLNVNSLRGRKFSIGDQVILQGTKPADPCSRMPEILGPHGYAAMMGIGGICAAIIEGGVIRAGDRISLLPHE